MINDFGTLFRISNLTQRFWTNYYLPKRVVKIVVLFFFFKLRPAYGHLYTVQYCDNISRKKKPKNPFFTWTQCASNFILQLPFSTLRTFSIFGQSNFFHIQKLATCLKRQCFCCSHGNRSANVTSNVVRNIAGNVALCVRPFNTSHYETNNHDNKKYNLVVRKEEKRKPQRRRVNKNTLLSKSCNFLIILSSI